MSPEITVFYNRSKPTTVDVPDKSGSYDTILGKVDIDMIRINPADHTQIIGVTMIDGRERLAMLSGEGRGATSITGVGRVEIKLHEPLRRKGEWRQRGHGIHAYNTPRSEESIVRYRTVHTGKPR